MADAISRESFVYSNAICKIGLLPASNQIYLVTFTNTQLTQASFLQKNQTLQNVFFDICNDDMAQSLSSLQKSEFLKLIVFIFHLKKLNN
jgi:hypothetical protein